jgi:hypothetical protein
VTQIDFMTAFGRLLRDGTLRDDFAANPEALAERICLCSADRAAWRQLALADVEFQADILLHKRLELVEFFLPNTAQTLGKNMWLLFRQYGRRYWPPEGSPKVYDAWQFCEHLRRQQPQNIVATEWNRICFSLSKRKIAIHWIAMPNGHGQTRRGWQIFLRQRNNKWLEQFFYLGL